MLGGLFILLAIFLPMIAGVVILLKQEESRDALMKMSVASLMIGGVCAILGCLFTKEPFVLMSLGNKMNVSFGADLLGKFFAVVVSIVWILGGVFSTEYMKHEKEEKRYFGFFVLVYGVLMALCFSNNLITYYFFYEMMTITSLPLVFHSKTREAITAGIKYLLYSLFGAYFVLFGIYLLSKYAMTLDFVAGGSLNPAYTRLHSTALLMTAVCMIVGFGVKAGMFPLHSWLPTAHPVAPAPASAVLSGIIVKMGVLGMIRSLFYVIGIDFIRGTWVQYMWMTLSLITVFLGSLMAYREKLFKKRLAYSTVSQVSYILFGLSCLQPQAMTGALLHVVFHATIKSCLFLCAGAIIFKTGKTYVDELTGIGKEMPIILWGYTFASLALIGIPPFSGFISKWYLATGALSGNLGMFSWFGPVVLLLSALLTAGYLLPVTINGFLPGDDYDYQSLVKKEPVKAMVVPVCILGGLTLLLGLIAAPLTGYISQITALFF